MYTEISAAIQSAKSLGELLRAAKSLSNYNEIVAAVSEVSSRLMEATAVALKSQERESELLQRLNELEKEVAKIRRNKELAQNYTLHKFETGALAYILKEGVTDIPPHYLCAKCSDEGVHAKLQPYGPYTLLCNTCSSKIQYKFAKRDGVLRSSGLTNNW